MAQRISAMVEVTLEAPDDAEPQAFVQAALADLWTLTGPEYNTGNPADAIMGFRLEAILQSANGPFQVSRP